jgi:hypothetical protein
MRFVRFVQVEHDSMTTPTWAIERHPFRATQRADYDDAISRQTLWNFVRRVHAGDNSPPKYR